jgi:HK97 family phage prohead protease
MTIERRALTAPLEVRADSRTIAGYAAVFNSVTDIGGMFREQIAPGAFKSSMAGDVRALFDHDTSHVLGRTKSETLRLKEDAHGLAVEIDLPDTQTGRDLRESMTRGDIDGMSFGFRVTKQEWDESGEIPLRTIREVELFEVSVVTFPAYADTEVALRSLEDARKEARKQNFNAAAKRLAMKADLALRKRGGSKGE